MRWVGVIAGIALAAAVAAAQAKPAQKTQDTLGQSKSAQNPPGAPAATAQAGTGGLLHLPVSNDPGVQKAERLLEQMVAALGGQAYLDIQDMQQQGRTYSFYHGESQGTGVLFARLWKWPNEERFDFREVMGEIGILPGVDITSKANYSLVFQGDSGKEITFRGTAALEPELLDDYLRRRAHSLPVVLRNWLKEPGVVLLYEGQVVAERKQADQVTVLNASNDAATISIDSITHLPLRVAFTWRDPKSRERTDEAEGYDNYRPIQGIMTPFSVTRYRNNQPVNQRFINSTSYNQGLADTMFAAPATIKPEKK